MLTLKPNLMFEQILQLVKEHIGNDPQIAAAIPSEHREAVHQEIAAQIHDSLQNQPTATGSSTPAAAGTAPAAAGGILSQIESSLASGGLATSAITGGLVGALSSKFGLPPAVSGAIAAAVPGLLQKLAHRSETPTA